MYQQLIETGTVNRTVTDFATFRDADLRPLDYNKSAIEPYAVSIADTVVAGDALIFVAPVAGAPGVGYPLSVARMPTAPTVAQYALFAGVALQGAVGPVTAAAAIHPSPTIQVATAGPALVRVEALATPAVGQRVVPGATTLGAVTGSATSDATIIINQSFGVFLSAKSLTSIDTNKAWIRIRHT